MSFKKARRLDTTLVKFVDDDADIAQHDQTLLKFVDLEQKDFDPLKDWVENEGRNGYLIE